jgi:hypothetical protein
MSTPPYGDPATGGDGTEPVDPAAARWGAQPATEPPAPPDPVSLQKPDAEQPLDFDPYRFGKPDHPIPPEYAPPGYQGGYQPPAYPPAGSPPPPLYPPAGSPLGYPPPAGYQPPPYPNFPNIPPPPQYNLHYPQPRTGNGKAIAALVLGIGSLVFCWLSIFDALLIVPALIFGGIALSEANRRPNRDGRNMAITALACTLVGAVLATVLTFVYYNKIKDCLDYNSGSAQYNQCIRDHF